MIKLQLKASYENPGESPFVIKAFDIDHSNEISNYEENDTAIIRETNENKVFLETCHGKVVITALDQVDFNGDVLLCMPESGQIQRLFRRSGKQNTFLITERCDQICAMCSQPPRDIDSSWIFPFYEKALTLVDAGAVIGFSGGEPTLYKNKIFEILKTVSNVRSDLTYHILTNCQHFTSDDVDVLKELHEKIQITWGVPLYSNEASLHNEIVGKEGAFEILLNNLYLLASTGAHVELRTVLLSKNIFELPKIAKFIKTHLSFIDVWAIMALEPIGFAKANKDKLFFDHSIFPAPLESAVQYADINGINVSLYNMPLCTVPSAIRRHSQASISDWKQKFLPNCDNCSKKSICCGFFEWYNSEWAWKNIHPI